MVGPYLPDEQEGDGIRQVGRPERGEAVQQVPGVLRRADLQDEQVTAMAKTASLKKTSRAGSRSVPNPLPDPAGSSGAEVVAIERNQRIIVSPHVAGGHVVMSWTVRLGAPVPSSAQPGRGAGHRQLGAPQTAAGR